MPEHNEPFLKRFYQQLADRSLEPTDSEYVELYGDVGLSISDPVRALATAIEYHPIQSAQLFSGFRGSGKSTELRRLRRELNEAGGNWVLLCDMQDYLNLSTPVDINDFLISMAGAVSEGIDRELGKDSARESYWTRAANFLTRTQVDIPELTAKAGADAGAELKLNLTQDPSFRAKLQEHLRGHLGALVKDVREFMASAVKTVRSVVGADTQVVILLDSLEHIRGTTANAKDVFSSVETLFSGHADKLQFPSLHVVYTAPPWLPIQAQGVAALFDGIEIVPCVKVASRDDVPFQPGLDALECIVRKRGDWKRLLGTRERLDRISAASGGYIRDLFRLLQRCIFLARGRPLPLRDEAILLAEQQVQNSYLPIAADDARWLVRVAASHRAELDSAEALPRLAHLFENHLVLSYRNGDAWYGVHPLVLEHARAVAQPST